MVKTVAFSWIHPLDSTRGGIERVTIRLMQGLTERGFDCLFILHDIERGCFVCDGRDVGELGAFLNRRRVDTLVNQNGYSSRMTQALDGGTWHGKYIVCHHNEPRYLEKLYDFQRVVSEVFRSNAPRSVRLGWCLRLLSYPIWRKWSNHRIAEVQGSNYQACDRYVVLSQSFIPEFSDLIGQPTVSKAIAIPNPLTFEIGPKEVCGFVKKNEVLIVARLNDAEKRISAALKAWKIIEDHGLDGWTLKVVGDGPDAAALQTGAQKLGLRRVQFFGRQESLAHFRYASIFLMTSRIEGWGLTLTEAMQTGTVPIAFDAFASLRDIITDGETGLIIPNGDIATLVEELERLMRDATRRQRLAARALKVCQKYRLGAVLDQWTAIL